MLDLEAWAGTIVVGTPSNGPDIDITRPVKRTAKICGQVRQAVQN